MHDVRTQVDVLVNVLQVNFVHHLYFQLHFRMQATCNSNASITSQSLTK